MPKRVWTAEKVIESIHEMEHAGTDLRHGAIQTHNKKLVSAAIRYFGSWKSAVEAAGVDYESLRKSSEELRLQKIGKWSRERILEEVRALLDRKEDMRAVVVKNKYPALFSAAVSPRYFGNWREAVSAAGVDYDEVLLNSPRGRPKRTDVWHANLILEKIREMHENGQPLDSETVASEHPRFIRLASRRFGSWHAAVGMAMGERPAE